MKWLVLVIIILSVTLILSMIVVIILIKKNKQKKIVTITNNLNNCCANLKLKVIKLKELPVSIENIKDDIYYSDKVILGKYENIKNIKNQNIILKTNYKKKKIFLRYKIRDINFIKSSNFIPLNQSDLLVSKKNLYFIDAFDSHTIVIANINSITFFWEKNNFIKNKQKYLGVEIKFHQQHLFFLFHQYDSAIKFIAHIMALN